MMSGWKTWAAAGLSAIYGIVGYFLGMHGADSMAQFVVGALGLVGIGHKIEKSAG